MRSSSSLLFFVPAIFIAVSWVAVVFIRQTSFIVFDNISYSSVMYLWFFFLSFLIGSFVGPFFCMNKINKSIPAFCPFDVKRKAKFLLLMSYIAIALLVFKFISLMGSFTFSVNEITELRLSRGRDSEDVKGGLVSGVLGMALAGFTVVSYIFMKYYESDLSPKFRFHLGLVFLLGIFVSFLSGGRWAAAISLVVAYIAGKLVLMIHTRTANRYDTKSVFDSASIFKFLVIVAVIYIFSLMFIARVMDSDDAVEILISVLNNNLEGVSVPTEHQNFLINNSFLIPIYFVVSLFQYYVGHALYQFDVLFSAEYPRSAPYYLAYQGYLYVTLLNKFGLDIISSQDILAEIVNPGFYFTLAGAFYLDFGYWGSGIAIFSLSLLGSMSWVMFLRRKSFHYLYMSTIYFVFILFSPIVTMLSTGIYPSLLLLSSVVFLLKPRLRGRASV